MLMLEENLAVASFLWSCDMCLFQNRVHGTSSRYKLATTNHHAQGFSFGKLMSTSFSSSISMCAYARRKASSRYVLVVAKLGFTYNSKNFYYVLVY